MPISDDATVTETAVESVAEMDPASDTDDALTNEFVASVADIVPESAVLVIFNSVTDSAEERVPDSVKALAAEINIEVASVTDSVPVSDTATVTETAVDSVAEMVPVSDTDDVLNREAVSATDSVPVSVRLDVTMLAVVSVTVNVPLSLPAKVDSM